MPHPSSVPGRCLALALLTLALGGCAAPDVSTPTFTPPVSGTVTVSPATVSLAVGASQALTVSTGGGVAGRTVAWTSANSAVATVSSAGEVTGIAPGATQVTADAGGIRAIVAVTVTPAAPPAVAAIVISPATGSVTVGGALQLVAETRLGSGAVVTGRAISWSSSAPAVANVSQSGVVSGVAPGAATITATSEGRSATVPLTVTPVPVATVQVTPGADALVVGATRALAATTRAADGSALAGRTVTWTTSAPAVANVSPAGVVTAIAAGSATITATSEGVAGTATITVTAIPVASVQVTPGADALVVGATRTLAATVRAADGSVLAGRTVSWTTSAPAVANVSPAGVVTAIAAGTATITATSEGVAGTTTITVAVPPVASVQVTPATNALAVGASRTLTATARAADGAALTGRAVAWTTSAPAVASVSPAGVVTAIAPGNATITATSEGVTGTATLTVTPVPVASVSLNVASIDGYAGQSVQLDATLRSAAGQLLTGRAITWTTSASTVAIVSTSGLVTLTGGGTATITATSEGATASAAVTSDAVEGALILEIGGPTVRRLDLASQGVTTLVSGKHGMLDLAGTALVFSNNSNCIATANADGSAANAVFCGGSNYVPVFHPDGQRIVFSRQPCGNASCQDLFVMTRAGGNLVQLTSAAGDDNFPQLSRDGTLLTWASTRDGNYEVYVMPMTGGAQARLAAHPGEDSYPRFIGATTDLMFRSTRGGAPDLYRMTDNGAQVTRLTFTGNVNGFAVSPSGRFVAYSTTGGTIEILHLPSGDVVRSITQAGWVFDWK